MSSFTVSIKKILAIEPHSNADTLEFACVEGYRSIVKKGQYQQNDLVAYIPENSLLPDWMLHTLNFWDATKSQGMLAGKKGNRVKAINLRGSLSQGVCYPVVRDGEFSGAIKTELGDGCFALVKEGDDVTEILGISKYEPPVPVDMAGEVYCAGTELTLSFDIENIKSYPHTFQEGENVIITEKLHGTCTVLAILPYAKAHSEGFGARKNIIIFSKGLGAKGLAFKNVADNKNNLYILATKSLVETIDKIQETDHTGPIAPEFILGETVGPKVQDLSYGKKMQFRVFSNAVGFRGNQVFRSWRDVDKISKIYGIETVPVLYKGPYSKEVLDKHTQGKTAMDAEHIREGVVVLPETERMEPVLGRVALKSISTSYLIRHNGTEFN